MKNVFLKFLFLISLLWVFSCTSENVSDSSATQVGSYSTMLVDKQKLYLVNLTQIKTFDISDPDYPVLVNETDLGFDIESLYRYNDFLLVGSRSGMHILEMDENGIPQKRSFTDYRNLPFCSYDPIVAKNNIAYVTLSSDDIIRCDGFILNELRVYDILKPENPIFLETMEMTKPKGLGLGLKKLYVCDEEQGLVIFDVTNPKKPKKESVIDGFKPFDLIVKGELLLVSCDSLLLQFNISDESNPILISTINI